MDDKELIQKVLMKMRQAKLGSLEEDDVEEMIPDPGNEDATELGLAPSDDMEGMELEEEQPELKPEAMSEGEPMEADMAEAIYMRSNEGKPGLAGKVAALARSKMKK